MCPATLALLIVAQCEPIAVSASPLQLPERQSAQARRLSNPELSRIRGGYRFLARKGEDGIIRLVQDSNTRDMTLAASVTAQQMDAWWGELGASFVAATVTADLAR